MKLFRVLYILILFCFLSKNLWAQDQGNISLLNSALKDVYKSLSSFSSVSYNLNITVKLDNSVSNSYKAEVFEVTNPQAHYSLYKLDGKDILFTYSDTTGIERFWFGRLGNLPEVVANQVDQKVFDSAITYSSLLINPSWLNMPFNLKEDQGFKVVQTYNKNLYSALSKVEFYLNKDNVPVRMLYYNSISNFPLIESLVTEYKKINNGIFITKITYKNSSNNKSTTLEKANIVINPKVPNSLLKVQKLIENNINNFRNSFTVGVRSNNDAKIPLENNTLYIQDSDSSNNSLQKGNSNSILNNSKSNNSMATGSKNGSSNNTLLQALQGLNSSSLGNKNVKDESNSTKKIEKTLKREEPKKSILKASDPKNKNVGNKSVSRSTNKKTSNIKANNSFSKKVEKNLKRAESEKSIIDTLESKSIDLKNHTINKQEKDNNNSNSYSTMSDSQNNPQSSTEKKTPPTATPLPHSAPDMQAPKKHKEDDLNSLF